MTSIDQLDQFLSENPDIEIFEVLLHDLNGAQRGKWLPRDKIHKLFKGGFKMPLSSCSLDYWGRDQDELIAVTGDSDGVCVPHPETLARVPWADKHTGQIIV